MTAADLSRHVEPLIVRAACPADTPAMADVFLASVTEMFRRNGVTTPIPPRAVVERSYAHVLATGSFRVAERGGDLVALAGAVVRDALWYLSAFWVRPGLQGQRLGMPLLRGLMADGRAAGATTFFTWSSVDIAAMAAYLKCGMLPGHPILQFEGTPGALPDAVDCAAVPLAAGVAEGIDEVVRGTRREADHRHWTATATARQVVRRGTVVGYYYLNRGAIGPAAWCGSGDAAAVLALACREAAAAGPIRLAAPGVNHAAVTFALDAGLRLAGYAHLLTSGPFGRLERYIPSGPSLF